MCSLQEKSKESCECADVKQRGVVEVKATAKLDWHRSNSNSVQEIQDNRITTYKKIGLHYTRKSDYIVQENTVAIQKNKTERLLTEYKENSLQTLRQTDFVNLYI